MPTLVAKILLKLKGINWVKVFLVFGVIALACWLIATIYNKGYSSGSSAIQAEWNADKAVQQKALFDASEKLRLQEQRHRQESDKISYDISQANLQHETVVAGLDAEYDRRLLVSEQRASLYQSQAEAGAAQCRSLASHAAELDRSLEEGRRLVQEFRSTLELRDSQLRALGEQILSDRRILGDDD